MPKEMTNIVQYRYEREQFVKEALNCPDYLDELREIEEAVQEQMDEIGWIMKLVELSVRPRFRCVKGGMRDSEAKFKKSFR
ncbi:hypothetical protein [Geobacter anodireducens]|uniref:Uncharacterized protein n=1 Tax=Geobacter anodireducens TaxID=1340425 RepID=A0ABR9NZE7_9BACT|nr:hypothetical protein [Geobacter anodireducens]MBE2889658.1 hypothetical protein [Geobacter anodireducens]